MAQIEEQVLARFLKGVQDDQLDYRGIIYAGIMATKEGPKVLEFNVRFGDPETQAVLARLESDLLEAMEKTASGRLNEAKLAWSPKTAVCVVMASKGYPGEYEKGKTISGIAEAEASGAMVFHAGTALKDGKLINVGGRVLGVTALGDGALAAQKKAYEAIGKISWDGASFRKDIAAKAIGR